MSTNLLAIDQGTSGTKAIVFDENGHALASATSPLKTDYGQTGTAEQNPDDIYRSALDAAKAAVERLEAESGMTRESIAAAGIANQRETFLLWDQDGRPLHNAVVWQCKRSVGICEELKASGAESEVRSRSGLIVDPYFSGTKVTWLMRNVPEIAAARDRGDARFGTVDSWLLYGLTGGAVHATDHTNASRTLMFNVHTLNWDDELIRLLDADGLILPELRPSAATYGESDFDGLFPHPVPISALIGDSHSAFFGERCFATGSAKATMGTGCSILLNAGNEAPAAQPSTMCTVGFSLPGRVDYALEGIIVSAGAVLTWIRDELALYGDASELEPMATSIPDAGGVAVVPGHAGLGAPFWKMAARGALHGLTFGTTKEHIVRAALESLPYQVRAILDAVETESGVRCSSLRADGGISRNAFVVQWMADCLNVPVHTLAMADVTALGAGLLAGIGAGIYSGVDDVQRLELDETVRAPGPDRRRARDGYAAWRTVVDRATG